MILVLAESHKYIAWTTIEVIIVPIEVQHPQLMLRPYVVYLTFRPYVGKIWSRYPRISGGSEYW